MDKRLAVVVACLALFGCAPKLMTGPAAVEQRCERGRPCEVNIVRPTCTTHPCSAEVDVDPVKFKRGDNDIVVRWKLPEGYGFCSETDDGVFLKGPDPHKQFKDRAPDGPEMPGVCGRPQFIWTARNTVSGLEFPYKIRFHNREGTREFIVDPVMFNE